MSGPVPDLAPRARPLLTADIPPAGGLFKATPEDFEVEELPAYVPEGSGEHLFLWVEKRGRDTPGGRSRPRLRAEARRAGDRRRGHEGSPGGDPAVPVGPRAPRGGSWRRFALEGVRILSAARHGNKLKTGHLKGNRFRLTLHGVRDVGALRASLERLEAVGLPNAFGCAALRPRRGQRARGLPAAAGASACRGRPRASSASSSSPRCSPSSSIARWRPGCAPGRSIARSRATCCARRTPAGSSSARTRPSISRACPASR